MINGSFGSGKTSTSQKLQPLIPNSMIYDPEEIGYMLRKIITEDIYFEEERTDDFQDIELWRILVVQTARELINRYKKHLIVPMTIYKSVNFNYILNGFRSIDRDTFHFCLVASEETIKKRIEERGDKFDVWYQKQTNAGVIAFNDIKFQEHIDTDNKETEEVIRIILRKISKINV
ncbi:AAA family ATPase [Paenibacillus polygoni]|uniref:AAA family ATPase n=1 Tax=Paenibacillus polygoni TaxID=3050112 RepID=A0ABY8XBK0_9BACL|nr:AAA family ATPase [Paenibacillus polygoni]WIV21488.1 AAA family ATPase [Paenibacillus polygoni]